MLLIQKEEAGNNCANQRKMRLAKRGSFFLNDTGSRKMGNMGIWGKTNTHLFQSATALIT